jgi:hypothetical protein
MSTRTNLITGIAIGSGMMFLLDPQQGNRRRARVREKATSWTRTTGRTIERTAHALEAGYSRVRAGSQGLVEAARRLASGTDQVSDEALAQRLRACIGRHSSHPRAIDVEVRDGCAIFSGPILESEAHEVLQCASAVRGVQAVDNRLELHADPGRIPELQGEGHRRSPLRWWELSPAVRFSTGAALAGAVALLASRKVSS